MYVIILEHPSCVTGNDVHTCVPLFRAFILQALVHICAFIHLFLQESSLSLKVCTLGKNVEAYFLIFRISLLTPLKTFSVSALW